MNSRIPNPQKGRPLFVEHEGGRIYVSAHDRWHLKILRKFKRQVFRHHPDRNRRGQGGFITFQILRKRKFFEERERRWYSQFGLTPPKRGGERCQSTGGRLLSG